MSRAHPGPSDWSALLSHTAPCPPWAGSAGSKLVVGHGTVSALHCPVLWRGARHLEACPLWGPWSGGERSRGRPHGLPCGCSAGEPQALVSDWTLEGDSDPQERALGTLLNNLTCACRPLGYNSGLSCGAPHASSLGNTVWVR